jgi:hypothetical protein
MLPEAVRDRTLWSPVVLLGAVVTLWAGGRSPAPPAITRAETAVSPGQEPAHRRFTLGAARPEQVAGVLPQLGLGTAAVVPECHAVEVAATDAERRKVQVVVDLREAGTAPDPDGHPPVRRQGPAEATASGSESANDTRAEVASRPGVRVIGFPNAIHRVWGPLPLVAPAAAPPRPAEEIVLGPPVPAVAPAGPGCSTSRPPTQGCLPMSADVPADSGLSVELAQFEPVAPANAQQVLRLDLPEHLARK